MNYAYVRVSTKEQSEARQIQCLEKYNIDRWYSEKVSGATMDRPKLQMLLKTVKSGDVVYITDFSRLARNTHDLLCIAEDFEKMGVTLVSDKERLDMSTASGKLLMTVIGAVNEFERQMMLERQAEGIEIAKTKGAYKNCGRKKTDIGKHTEELIQDYVDGIIKTKAQLAMMLNISRPTLNRILKEYGEV